MNWGTRKRLRLCGQACLSYSRTFALGRSTVWVLSRLVVVGKWLRRLDLRLEWLVFCDHEVEVVHRGQADEFHFKFSCESMT